MRSYSNGFIVGVFFFFFLIQNKEKEVLEEKNKREIRD